MRNPWLKWLAICAITLVAACVLLTLAGAWDDEAARTEAAGTLAGLWVFTGLAISSWEIL